MKRIIFSIFLCLFGQTIFAQWNPNGAATGNIYYNNGNVGLGTNAPDYKLHIKDGIGGAQLKFQRGTGEATIAQDNNINNLYLDAAAGLLLNTQVAGNVGIGIVNPEFKLQIATNTQFSTGIGYVETPAEPENEHTRSNFGSNVYWDATTNRWTIRPIGANDFCAMLHLNGGSLAFVTGPSTSTSGRTYTHGEFKAFEKMRITGEGNVGIGTTTPGSFKLAVEGKIGAREVNVTTANPWPDYVFENNYNLPTLAELEAYIKVNKHLPEVPSACTVENNGVNLGEMNMLLLKKVEELTLYMIELKKEVDHLKNNQQK